MEVAHLNSLNLQNTNVHAETFFRDFLNLAFDYELRNINIVERNAKAVDLGDEIRRIAIQVTSTSEIGKIKHSYDGFVRRGLDDKYDRLVVLIIGEKRRYQVDFLGKPGEFRLSISDDVWDIAILLRNLSDLSSDRISLCADFLRKELRIVEPKEANEVYTLVRLIEVLSNADGGLSTGDNRIDPDPEHKILDRFASHAEFLQRQYVKLHEIYNRALAEVERQSDLGHIRILKLQVFLMNWSDSILAQCGGDPEAALNEMVKCVIRSMGNSATPFDNGAVRYYLVNQLIACNVFPNKQIIDA
jgi:hypothetical protein